MEKRSNRIVMTGSSGFIGNSLQKSLEAEGWDVYSIVRKSENIKSPKDFFCETNDLQTLRVIFEGLDPRFVISLAGRTGPGRDLDAFSVHYQDNILPALNLAKTIPTSVELALFFGSCEEYGNGPAPFREEQPLVAFSPYGWGKISAHHATLLTCKERGVRYCWLRPFLVFGPGQETDQLVPSVVAACKRSKRLALTPGEQTRDFVYIDDLIGMIKRILHDPEKAKDQVLNLGSGVPRTIREVASSIRKMIGKGELDFGALPYRSFEAMSFYASNEKYNATYGEFPLTDFEQALKATIEGTLE